MSASSNSIITQCPGCNASFRVSPGQLKVAAGQEEKIKKKKKDEA